MINWMFNGGIKKAAPKGSVAGVSLIFNLKLVEAESRISKYSSEQRECLHEEKCSQMRVAKCL